MHSLNQQTAASLEQVRADSSRTEEDEKLPTDLAPWLTQDNDALRFLSDAIAAGRPVEFAEYMAWVKMMLGQQEGAAHGVVEHMERLRGLLVAALPAEMAPLIHQYLDAGLQPLTQVSRPPGLIQERQRYAELAQQYLDALLRADRQGASRLISEAVDQGVPIEDIYQYVLQPSQGQVGLLWQEKQLSVAQEHYCTAVTQLVMAQLYTRMQPMEAKSLTAIVVCVSSELHDLGARMVATFLEQDGWQTLYLGANTPTADIVGIVETSRPDVLFLSATIAHHVTTVQGVIRAVRAARQEESPKILVGGYSFNIAPDLWLSVGADGYAPNAEEAVALANHLARARTSD